jgi:hypothetical protein
MTQHRAIGILVAILSAGWLFPLWLAVHAYLSFWQVEAWPLLQDQHPMNSFPFIRFAEQCFSITFAWLAVVVSGWSYAGYAAFTGRRRAA